MGEVAVWVTGAVSLLGVTIAGLFALKNRRSSDLIARQSPPLPSYAETWDEIRALRADLILSLSRSDASDARADKQERRVAILEQTMTERDRAFASVLADAAAQWPVNVTGPVFDKRDLDVLGDTVPHRWAQSHKPFR